MNVKSRKTGKPSAPAETRRPYRSAARAQAADATRTRIIDAARTLFIGGPDLPAFSVDGVARQAGVTRLTVYNQFESKLGLLEAVFDDIAERGGLIAALPSIFIEPDPHAALRRFVSVFCGFWTRHKTMMPAFQAVIKIDEDIAASLQRRTERRRHILGVLVERLAPGAGKANADLVDLLYVLTSFDTFDALSARNRNAKAVEALMQTLVEQTVRTLLGTRG
ncbi:TetR/AcrR family transcriptional regulator [Rudaea sp.]|uniref:TetR/AcrR family transcriptional regulator n=1 Tax=Rudaea sp. TaxID=2136325 RepID=UPI002ED138FC